MEQGEDNSGILLRPLVWMGDPKKSNQGIKTPQSDVDLIKQRYKDAIERAQ